MLFNQWTPYLWVTQSELYATNHGVFIAGDQACLIDPGLTPESLQAIADFVTEHDARPRALVLTHGHWDHILGPEAFAGPEAADDLRVIAHVRYLDVLDAHEEDLQQQIERWETESNIERQRPFVSPRPTHTFTEAMYLWFDDVDLQIMHAPGHAPDQCVVYHTTTGMLWAGDMLSDCEIPMVMDSLDAYENTLAHLADLDVQILVPGHGTPTDDPAEIRTRFEQDRIYLAALRERITHAVQVGMTQEEAVAHCADIPRAQLEQYASAHQWNVESIFAELGGSVEDSAGWEQDWQ